MLDSDAVRGRCSRPALLTLVVGLTAGGVASAQTKSLTVGSKDFSGAQAISQAYGQALENKGYDISFKDNLGATEIVYKALENGDLDGYADYQGTLLTYLGGSRPANSAETYKAPAGEARGHRHRGEQAGARGRRERLLRHQGHGQEVQAQEAVGPHQGRAQAHVRRTARVRGRGRSASATRRSSSTA